MLLNLLPWYEISMVWEYYLKIEDRFPGFDTRDYINLKKLKEYIQYQWIDQTCPKFLSVFGTKISTTNGPERFNKKLNSSVGGSKPNIWKFLDVMNKVLDEASLDLATLEANQEITRTRARISDENLNHRLEAENRYNTDRNFSAVCFIEFMAEKWGTKYFENIQAEYDDQNLVQQVNEEPIQTNTDLCVLCSNPRNGTTNWGFLHNGEVHHNYCETCKDTLDKKPGDLCPLCDSPIDLVVKMS